MDFPKGKGSPEVLSFTEYAFDFFPSSVVLSVAPW